MKVGWEIKTLGDVCERVTVGHVGITSPYYRDEGILFLRTQNVGNSGLVLDDRKYVTPEFHAALKKSEVKAGDILMSRVITHTVHCALIPSDLGPANCANVVLVRPASKLIPKFLVHYIRSSEAQRHLLDRKVGSAQLVVNTHVIKSWPVPVPSIPEQHRIVAILDEAFDSIATAKANAEKNLQNARALFESHLQAVFSQRGDDWSVKKLGDPSILKIIDGDRGSNYPSKEDFSDEGFCLFLNTKNVRPDGFNFDTTMFITEEKDKLLRKGKLQRQDIILTTRGTIGNVALFDESVEFEDIRINSGMLIFRPYSEKILPSFLFEVFRSGIMKSQMIRHVSGAAQPQLPIKTLIDFEIPVPSKLESQLEIVASVRGIEEEIQRLESIYQQKLAALAELKKSLLHQAFSGQL